MEKAVADEELNGAPEGEEEIIEETQVDEPEAEGEEELSIEIEGADAEDETPLVKQLRHELRDTQRELAAHRKPQQIEVGPKPTLESCDFDEERYEREYDEWKERTREAENATAKAEQLRAAQVQRFERAKASYMAAGASKGLDLHSAEQAVIAALSPEWLGAIVTYSKSPETIVAALHKYPAKLAEIASEPDDVKKMRLLWELEGRVVINRRKPPAPEGETVIRGSAALSQTTDKKLEALEKDAERTGDRTKVIQYKREQRRAA